MSIRLLFVDVYWFNENGVLEGPGYIALRSGIIEGMGIGEPPEEMQYAEYLAGGSGRVVLPGFILGPIVPETYMFKDAISVYDALDIVKGSSRISKYIANLGSEEAYYASLMMFYEAAMNGYTSVIAVSPNAGAVTRALEDSGLYGLVLVPEECGYYHGGLSASEQTSLQRVKLGKIYCRSRPKGEGVELADDGLVYVEGEPLFELPPWNGEAVPGPGTALAANPWPLLSGLYKLEPLKVYKQLTLTGYYLLDSSYQLYKGQANLVVVDSSEPPSWLIPQRGITVKYLSPSRPRVETVVSMGRIVIDGGEHMYIGSSKADEARKKLSKLLRSFTDD
jgi:cytosine/adenosine deaminase-related metal-dependent hydrolase